MFVIMHLTVNGWENSSTVVDEQGRPAPLTFVSEEEAGQELMEHLQLLEENRMDHDPSDWRVKQTDDPFEGWTGV